MSQRHLKLSLSENGLMISPSHTYPSSILYVETMTRSVTESGTWESVMVLQQIPYLHANFFCLYAL